MLKKLTHSLSFEKYNGNTTTYTRYMYCHLFSEEVMNNKGCETDGKGLVQMTSSLRQLVL
jgi:hypothetical protein